MKSEKKSEPSFKKSERRFSIAKFSAIQNIVKHRKHALVLTGVFVFLNLSLGIWFGWQYWQLQQITTAHQTVDSKFKGIKIESNTYDNPSFHGYIAYAITENAQLNSSIRKAVDAKFLPCKDKGLKNNSDYKIDCNASFNIDFANKNHLQITYSFKEASKYSSSTQKAALLFNRKKGSHLTISDLFKVDEAFLKTISKASRKALQKHFGADYSKSPTLQNEIAKVTEPTKSNFNNFIINDEKLTIIFNQIAGYGDINVSLGVTLLEKYTPNQTLASFFPKYKKIKDTERRKAEETKKQAVVDQAARLKTRSQVAPNRSNINCAVMKCIALTFDDGPWGHLTNHILDALEQRGAVATFFVLGSKVSADPGTARRAVAQKSEVANHTWGHADLATLSPAEINWQVDQTNQAIFNATGSYPKLLRPPYGSFNNTVINQSGLPIAMWSIDTNDWVNRNSDTVYQAVISQAFPGATVLMHDIHETTAWVVPRIIDELQRQGYVLVTMSELFGINKDNIKSFSGQVLRGR